MSRECLAYNWCTILFNILLPIETCLVCFLGIPSAWILTLTSFSSVFFIAPLTAWCQQTWYKFRGLSSCGNNCSSIIPYSWGIEEEHRKNGASLGRIGNFRSERVNFHTWKFSSARKKRQDIPWVLLVFVDLIKLSEGWERERSWAAYLLTLSASCLREQGSQG